jgi:hypothetical protein
MGGGGEVCTKTTLCHLFLIYNLDLSREEICILIDHIYVNTVYFLILENEASAQTVINFLGERLAFLARKAGLLAFWER